MNVTLSVETAGQRADQFLAARLDGLTRSAAQKLLEEGHVLCQGRPLKKNDRLKPGDQVAVCIPDPTPVELLPQDIPLEVVYEDEDVIVVNKPVGMVVHPATPTAPWSTRCSFTAARACPASMASFGRGSSTGLTGTPAACSSRPKMTGPTWPWPSSSRTTASTGNMRRWFWATCGRTRAPSACPLPATPRTGKRWR